jgi:glycine/D-amino acid oxidase-like deaminating enzyme/nitrite reductase/ring-hydroxylating ferredoxin subunit
MKEDISLTSGMTTPLWLGDCKIPEFPALTKDFHAEICIVGAGITGLTTAYTLLNAGKKVIVLDDGEIGSGETGRTTAHLSYALDDRYYEIARVHGKKNAKLVAESHKAAIDYIEHIITQEKIDCDFQRVDGYLIKAIDSHKDILHQELAAVKDAGITNAYYLEKTPLDGFEETPCLCFPQQAQFHPLKYLTQLAKIIEQKGGHIFTHTRVIEVLAGESVLIKTQNKDQCISANSAIIASNTPINDKILLHSKLTPYRSYVLAAKIPKGSMEPALYWDTANPYHYIRMQQGNGHDWLIVGGNDHKTGKAATHQQAFNELKQWARQHFPAMGEIGFLWSGQIQEPIDYLAYIGHHPLDGRNIYIATGDSGNGMTHGTLAGLLLTDLILGRKNPWESIYRPSRLALKTIPDYTLHALQVVSQYRDYVTPAEVASLTEIAPGSGALIRHGLSKMAIYRDEEGKLHPFSSVCTHLQGIVAWNPLEKSWDCPVHGSRFDRLTGKPLNGPACKALIKIEHVENTLKKA